MGETNIPGWLQLVLCLVMLISFICGAVFQYYNPAVLLPSRYCNSDNNIPSNPSYRFFNTSYSMSDIRFLNIKQYDIVRVVSNTDSMHPTITSGSYILAIFDFVEEDIKVGSIIGFTTKDERFNPSDTIIHRVLKIELIDGQLIYTTKGDNNIYQDSLNTTFEDIKYIVGGIFY